MKPLVVGALLLRMGLGGGVDEMEVVADVRKQRRHIADSTDLPAPQRASWPRGPTTKPP